MSTRRLAAWKLAAIAMAATAAVALVLRPAAAALILIVLVMAGPPALYRLRAADRPQMLEPSGGRPAGGCGEPPRPAASGQDSPKVYAVIDNEP